MFGLFKKKQEETPQQKAAVTLPRIKKGLQISYYGKHCKVTDVNEGCAKLEFEVQNGSKVGTDGWYKLTYLIDNEYVGLVNLQHYYDNLPSLCKTGNVIIDLRNNIDKIV